MARRNAIGQALGRLALAAGVSSLAGPMALPAYAETTAVKKVRLRRLSLT